MLKNRYLRIIFLMWLAWAIIVIGFQKLVEMRMQPDRPDYATDWTSNETNRNSQSDKIYLTEPFMNRQVSWDSEFYLSIATYGYDDPNIRLVTVRDENGQRDLSMNYAFFPLYPMVMGAVAAPLKLLGMEPIAASSLAGVFVALLGTLAGLIALYDLVRDELGDEGGLRAGFYLLIFPTGFFLAQVYTEGLFIGFAFGTLALLKRRMLIPAAVLAMLATWTRSVGALLIIPLALVWLNDVWVEYRAGKIQPLTLAKGLLVLAPLAAYLIWRVALGEQFELVETTWFGRNLLDFEGSFNGWKGILSAWGELNPQRQIYMLLEISAVLLALVACLFTLRRYPGVALFGLAVLFIALTSGYPQSLIRYVLVIPSITIFLSRLGRNIAFDRAWTVASLLLMGLLVTLFTYDMWVA